MPWLVPLEVLAEIRRLEMPLQMFSKFVGHFLRGLAGVIGGNYQTTEPGMADSMGPIVFVVVSDPIGSGFVASLPHPGGNITGFINYEDSLAGKWIEIVKDIVPGRDFAARAGEAITRVRQALP